MPLHSMDPHCWYAVVQPIGPLALFNMADSYRVSCCAASWGISLAIPPSGLARQGHN